LPRRLGKPSTRVEAPTQAEGARDSAAVAQPQVVAVLLAVLCRAATARGDACDVLGEAVPAQKLASILEHLPRHLFRARLDWSLHVGDRRDMVTRLDELLTLWALVRPDESFADQVWRREVDVFQ